MPDGHHLPATSLAAAIRQALEAPRGRVALVTAPLPEARRRVARALLAEGALAAGGRVAEAPGGEVLLLGAEALRAGRLAGLVGRLVGPVRVLELATAGEALRALGRAHPGRDPGPPPPMGEGAIEAAPLPTLLRRFAGEGFLRLDLDRAALRDLAGPDPALLAHAARGLSARLLRALADSREGPALLGGARPRRLHLPMAAPAPPPGPGLVATLPLSALAGLPARGGGLVELDGLDAATLPLLDPAALPADLLRLHWSPALPAALPDLAPRLDPARVVLAGAETPEALAWARAQGITQVERPA